MPVYQTYMDTRKAKGYIFGNEGNMNIIRAIQLHLKHGRKIRRTVWPKGAHVVMLKSGSLVMIGASYEMKVTCDDFLAGDWQKMREL